MVKSWFDDSSAECKSYESSHREKLNGLDGTFEIDVTLRFHAFASIDEQTTYLIYSTGSDFVGFRVIELTVGTGQWMRKLGLDSVRYGFYPVNRQIALGGHVDSHSFARIRHLSSI